MSKDQIIQARHQDKLVQAEKALSKLQAQTEGDPHRLQFHFMAPAAWINDPNGLIYFKGEYHLFYQLHPYSADNGPKHWGHAKSKDLVSWEHLPIALAPSEDYERHGCFSGTAVDDDGTFTLIYTGNVWNEVARQKKQVQCMATSEDGITFRKYVNNPVIGEFPEEGSQDFRDPKVWRHDEVWYMAVGSGKDGKGNALLYSSPDLLAWKYVGKMAEAQEDQGTIWNCPDFFTLAGTDVLLVAPAVSPSNRDIRRSIYMIGKMDYPTGVFTQMSDGDIDFGPDFYAPQTLVDENGRVILIGWMDMWFNEMPTKSYGWAGAMTIPRVVKPLPGGKLAFEPLPELQTLRREHRRIEPTLIASGAAGTLGEGDSFEIIAEFELDGCSADQFGFRLRCSPDGSQETLVLYDLKRRKLMVDRRKSGAVDGGVTACAMEPTAENTVKLHIFLDRSSVEVFGNGGQVTVTNRIYPGDTGLGLEMTALGGSVRLLAADVWKLASIW